MPYGNLTPPFVPPDITDPTNTANAGQGYAEFQALKDYVVSFLQIWFDCTTGQFLNTTVLPPTSIPRFTGDCTTPAPSSSTSAIVTTVARINGQSLASLATGLLKNITSTGVPVIATAQTDYLAPYATGLRTAYATGQQLGTTTNDSASAGNVGEVVFSAIASGSAVSLTNNTASNITSISLTAGDWDVWANANFSGTSATVTQKEAGIGSTSATLPTDGTEVYSGEQTTTTTAIDSITLTKKRFSLSTTTTIYLVGKSNFSAGTMTGFGSLHARRVR
jgi:hypothetical protein